MTEINGATLRSISGIKSLYILPGDPLAEEVLIPGFQKANQVDCMAGFFSSEVLASLAPGLATFINNSQERFRLVISPFLRDEDRAPIEEGVRSPEDVAYAALEEIVFTEDLVQEHTLKCLSWLLRIGRIEIRIALMKNALFHLKVWLFRGDDGTVAAHGSSNATRAGIGKNIEQVAVSKSWEDPNQRYTVEKFCDQFERFWGNKDGDCIVVGMPQAVQERLLQTYRSDAPPIEEDFSILYGRATGVAEESSKPYELPELPRNSFAIPADLRFEDGPFEHQGRAVEAWCGADYRGVLEMATGSGKTITAMICAYRLYETHKPLLIVVAAPYVPLIEQWCDEIAPFGLRPVNLTVAAGPSGRARELNRIKRRLRHGMSDVEIVVVSHRTLCNSSFKAEVEKFDCTTLLIADEAHNLGSEGFIT